jgi:hypothetical protein
LEVGGSVHIECVGISGDAREVEFGKHGRPGVSYLQGIRWAAEEIVQILGALRSLIL